MHTNNRLTSRALPEIPADLRKLMADIGPRWAADVPGHIRLMIDRFSEVLQDAPRDGVAVERELRYGAHARQSLDVYLPERPACERAALLFVHGGAFVDGDRNRTEQIYSNVLYYFARRGVVGVNIGYRLAHEAPYPGATLDVASAIQWVRQNADRYAIAPQQIFLMGHSAGCAHAASYAYDERLQPAGGPGVRGLIIVSGRMRAETSAENPNAKKVEAYYGTADPGLLDDMSPVSHVGAASVPTFIAWGEFENPLIDVHCSELVYRLAAAKRRSPPVLWLRGHNHTSTIAHFNTAEEALGRAILDFVARPD